MELRDKNTFEAHASKRISYVLTTKNRAEYLQKALEMHHRLITPEDELIIVDGGSTDNTPDIIRQYSDSIDTFISEPDVSPGHAFSKGMLLANGKYLKFSTDDDEIYPAAMEQAIRVMEEYPEVDILVCGGTRQTGDQISTVYIPPGVDYGSNVKDIFKYGASGIGFIIRRRACSTIGLFHPLNLVADKEFVLRAISHNASVKFCRIDLYHHTIYSHSVTVSRSKQFKDNSRELYKQYYSLRFYYLDNLSRWRSKVFIPWLIRNRRLYRIVKFLYHIPSYMVNMVSGSGKSKAVPEGNHPENKADENGFIWDGGFS